MPIGTNKIGTLQGFECGAELSAYAPHWYFNNLHIDKITVISYKLFMRDESFFLRPVHEWQRRYEALRASFVERLPARVIAERFGYSLAYVHLLRHLFTHQKIDFSEPVPEGKANRRRLDAALKAKICSWREQRLSAGEITALLSEEGVEVSVRTIERVLAEEGFPKLPRRSRLKLGLTVKGAQVPAVAEKLELGEMPTSSWESEAAGVMVSLHRPAQPAEGRGGSGTARHKDHPRAELLSVLPCLEADRTGHAHLTDHALIRRSYLPASMPLRTRCPPTPTAWMRCICCACSRASSSRPPGSGSMRPD
jgi:transposase